MSAQLKSHFGPYPTNAISQPQQQLIDKYTGTLVEGLGALEGKVSPEVFNNVMDASINARASFILAVTTGWKQTY